MHGGDQSTMYHGVDRRKLTDRRNGERRKFDPIAAQAYEEGIKRGQLIEKRRLEDRRKRSRLEAERILVLMVCLQTKMAYERIVCLAAVAARVISP